MYNSEIMIPAIMGVQSNNPYYSAMCPIELLIGLFKYEDPALPPAMKMQRVLNKSRIPEMRDYVLSGEYTFSALTASIDGSFEFLPVCKSSQIGSLKIDVTARVIINDGQHRREALIRALESKPELRNEHIVIVFYKAEGIERAQQIFTDLNKHAIRPTKSLNILFDNRENFSKMVREVIDEVVGFSGRIEMEKTSISNRSTKLYTLSGVYSSIEELTRNLNLNEDEIKNMVIEFYTMAYRSIDEWRKVIEDEISACEFRKNYITAHAVFIKALGKAGHYLLERHGNNMFKKMASMKKVNLRKDNNELQGIIIHGNRINGAAVSVKPLANYILDKMGEDSIC
jgi:DNA sulfur modification protein DndB